MRVNGCRRVPRPPAENYTFHLDPFIGRFPGTGYHSVTSATNPSSFSIPCHVVRRVELPRRLLEAADVDLVSPPSAQDVGHRVGHPGPGRGGIQGPDAGPVRCLHGQREGADRVRQTHEGDRPQAPVPQRRDGALLRHLVVGRHGGEPQVDGVDLLVLALAVPGHLLHHELGEPVPERSRQGWSSGTGSCTGRNRVSWIPTAAIELAVTNFLPAAIDQVAHQAAGALDVDPHLLALVDVRQHRGEVHGDVYFVPVEPAQVLPGEELPLHPGQVEPRIVAAHGDDVVAPGKFPGQAAADESAGAGDQDYRHRFKPVLL